GPRAERGETVDRDEALVDARELRADVEVDAGDVQAEPARLVDGCERGVGREAELRLVVRGLDRLVRDRLDPRGEPAEHPPNAGGSGARRLIGRVEDDGRLDLRGGAQLLVRLVVAVEEDPVAAEPRLSRESELAEGRHVGA